MEIIILLLVQNLVFGLYIAYRIYVSFFKKYNVILIMGIILIINNIFIITRVLNKYAGITVPDWIIFCAHIIFGISVYVLLLFLITDVLRIIANIIKKPFISFKLQGIIVISLSLLIFIYGYINSHYTNITEYNVVLNKEVTKPFRIAAVSDIHIGADMSPKRLLKEVEIINNQNPDIILLAGDMIDNNVNDFTEDHIKAFNNLKAPLGVYAVYGNHEYYSGSFDEVFSLFTKAGFNTLVDNVTYINDYNFYILGRDSLRHTNSNGSERKQIEEFSALIEDKSKPLIILDHVPKGLTDGKKINADIQISGHTHDGQFFPVNLIVRHLNVLSHGIINDNGFYYIVSSGLGLWGPPMRVGTKSEIVIINVSGK